MPAVVAPDDDDRVIPRWAFLQGIQYMPNAIIRCTGSCQIGLHRPFEQIRVLLHPPEIRAGREFGFTLGVNDIAKVIESKFRDLD